MSALDKIAEHLKQGKFGECDCYHCRMYLSCLNTLSMDWSDDLLMWALLFPRGTPTEVRAVEEKWLRKTSYRGPYFETGSMPRGEVINVDFVNRRRVI